jgi:hypothetical protein
MGGAGGCLGTEGKSIRYLVGKPEGMRQFAERVDGSGDPLQIGVFNTQYDTVD